MELNWSTFILEIINFGVLLWILRHFLYRPVLAIIERRRQKINDAVEQAKQDREKAESLLAEYNNRLEDWQREREKALEKLQQELSANRAGQLEKLQRELAGEREKARVAAQREQQSLQQAAEKAALRQGSEFAARLLAPLADKSLEAALVKLFVSELESLSDEARAQIRAGSSMQDTVEVASAWALDEDQKQALQQALGQVLQNSPTLAFQRDASLLAGLRVVVGGMVLGANLRDELKAFAEFHGNDGVPVS